MVLTINNKHIYAVKAEFLWMKKDYYHAALNYQKALLLDEDSSYLNGAYLFLGVLYEKSGFRAKAQIQYLKAVYFFEHRKRKSDRFFENINKIDYAIALKLSMKEKEWEKLISEPFYHSFRELYNGNSRDEVLEIYWKEYDGGLQTNEL